MRFVAVSQSQRNADFFGAVVGCPMLAHEKLGRRANPEKYTLGEVTLLRMLGLQAGQWLDLEQEEVRAYVEMRKPRVTEPNMPERKYHRYACTLPEWWLARVWLGSV
jgi:hypothetical protein